MRRARLLIRRRGAALLGVVAMTGCTHEHPARFENCHPGHMETRAADATPHFSLNLDAAVRREPAAIPSRMSNPDLPMHDHADHAHDRH